jgi:excisionase family DNA binding protein
LFSVFHEDGQRGFLGFMANKNSGRVFTSGEVAEVCGVSADTVSRWFDLGQIEGYRLGPGGDRRIPYENLRKFMLGHGIPLDRLEDDEFRILVVDDDPYYLDIIPAALSRNEDYKIAVASTGYDAGSQVVEHNPHVIVLDIHLTDMDGRLVCERVKSRPETKGTRIIAISGFISPAEAKDLSNHGFDDYLKKPFSLEDLIAKVQVFYDAKDGKKS